MIRFLCCCQTHTNLATEPVAEALSVGSRLNMISNNHSLDYYSMTTAGTCRYNSGVSDKVEWSPSRVRSADNVPSYQREFPPARGVVVKIKTYPAQHKSSLEYAHLRKTIDRTRSFCARPKNNDETNAQISPNGPPAVPSRSLRVKRSVSFNLPADKQSQMINFQRY